MKAAAGNEPFDLWEAWIDLSTTGNHTLYVLGDVYTGRSKTAPVLVKKAMQGAAASHLILEVLAFEKLGHGRCAEVGYTERISNIYQYRHVSICSGEEIIAQIREIEVVY